MWLIPSAKSRLETRIETRKIVSRDGDACHVSDRQTLIPGFSQAALEKAKVILVGGGGIGSEVAEGLARKGVGSLAIYDHDVVELSNLNRQHFFACDIGCHKGVRLAKNIARHVTCGSVISGYGYSIQDAIVLEHDLHADAVVCGVDNNLARVETSRFFRKLNIPVVFIAVDYAAEQGYVFVQEPGKACFGCLFPDCLVKRTTPCRTPAVKDVLKVVAGISLYAIDSLLMERKRNWNYRNIHLAGFAPDSARNIEFNSQCPLCGGKR